jgi:predicted NodU family carbamoyl transferase
LNTMLDTRPTFEPFTTVVTIRFVSKVLEVSEEAKHWDQYRDLIKWARSLRDAGWRLEHVETIDRDITD